MKKPFYLLPLILLTASCSMLDLAKDLPENSNIVMMEQSSAWGPNESDSYYYYFGDKIFLKERQDLLLVCFVDAEARRDFIQSLNSVSCLKVWSPPHYDSLIEDNYYNVLVLQTVGTETATDLKKDFENRKDVRYISFMYGENESHLSSVSDEFSVKLRGRSDYSVLEKISQEYKCEIVRHEGFDENIVFVRRPKNSEYNTIRLSALFFETGAFEFTSPGFFNFGSFASNDPKFNLQWNLKNTGQYGSGNSGIDIKAESAWAITEGSSDIIVAVLDSGVQLNHSDLDANLISGYDAVNPASSYAGAPVYSSHGTSVAGIIGAEKDNEIGVSGVSPGCKIMPVCVTYDSFVDYNPVAVRGFDWARTHGADVINCSWGGGSEDELLTSAINNAVTNGRDGKGCVVVFASGNTYYGDNVDVQYPGRLGNVMAVGAVSYNGKRKNLSTPDGDQWSSNYGSTLDISAPGVFIPSTTTGNGYTNMFGGTSAATPHVAGIAALLLSEYPDLTQSEVRYLIESGATYLPGHSYYSDGGYPARAKSNEVGYGLANAAGAFQQAALLQQKKVLDATPGVDFTITNNSSYTVDEIYLEVTADVGGISTTLISADPGGLESGEFLGYPVYRGESFSASPGTAVTNISVSFYARTLDCSGDLRIGIEFDNHIPTYYSYFAFGWGDTYQTALPNTTVPTASRRRLYINLLNP